MHRFQDKSVSVHSASLVLRHTQHTPNSNSATFWGRSASVYQCVHCYGTDANIVNYLSNDLKQSCFQITFKAINVKRLKNCEKASVPMCTDTDQTCISFQFSL